MCNDHFMKLWIVRLERGNCMKGFKEFLGEEDGVAIIEIVLILVILIGLIVVFNTKIKSLNTKILKKITIESNKLL